MIAEKRLGKPVHRTTSTKINQTWFASQTGPIDRSIWLRTRVARGGASAPPDSGWLLPASRSQTPAPKSAPPKIAYSVTPIQRITTQTSAVLMPMPPPAEAGYRAPRPPRSEEHTSELQSPDQLVCRLLLEKKKKKKNVILLQKKKQISKKYKT